MYCTLVVFYSNIFLLCITIAKMEELPHGWRKYCWSNYPFLCAFALQEPKTFIILESSPQFAKFSSYFKICTLRAQQEP